MIAVGHVKNPFTFTYVNFLYAFASSFPYAALGWAPLDLDARVSMGMCVGSCTSGALALCLSSSMTISTPGAYSRWKTAARCFCRTATATTACGQPFMKRVHPCRV